MPCSAPTCKGMAIRMGMRAAVAESKEAVRSMKRNVAADHMLLFLFYYFVFFFLVSALDSCEGTIELESVEINRTTVIDKITTVID